MSNVNNVSSSSSSTGVGFAGLLTIVFITLKLTDVIDWSWVWVLSPLWISFSIGLLTMLIVLVIALIVHGKSSTQGSRRRR